MRVATPPGTGRRRPLQPLWRALARSPIAVIVAMVILLALIVAAVFGPWIAPHDPTAVDLSLHLKPPGTPDPQGGAPFLLGTDSLGRDTLSRIMSGASVTLLIGFLSVVLSGVIGVAVGLIAGYYGGRIDALLMRFVDIQLSFPTLLIALFVLYVLGQSFVNVILILAAIRWVVYARVTRGLVVSARNRLYVRAAQSMGARAPRVIFRHILPNIVSPIVVLAVLEVAVVVLAESALSFLGLGVQPPQVSWGQLLAESQPHVQIAWWLAAFPGLAIMLTTFSLNIIGSWAEGRVR